MELAFTHESEPVSQQADVLFAEWLKELPEGSLREHVYGLSQIFRNLNPAEHALTVVSASSHRVMLTGYWLVEGRCEIIGPYVRPDTRNQGLGTWGMKTACLLASMHRDLYILAPASEVWMTAHLDKLGFFPVKTYLADGAGDHRAYHADLTQLAKRFLDSVQEPQGRGRWALVLLNDDETPFDVVTETLQSVLGVDDEVAASYASLVHHEGSTLLRWCLSQRGANTLAHRIEKLARMAYSPLRAKVEKR